jgi:DNA-binding NtrC family response regulator
MSGDADTRDLVTDPRSGPARQPGVLAVFSDGRPMLAPIALVDGEAVLGRDDALGITDDRVSRRHAIARCERGRWQIADQNSRNGTFVNGDPIEGTAPVEPPRVVRLAYTLYLLVDDLGASGDGVRIDGDRCVGPALATVLSRVRAAAGDNVLLAGETGVGKELAARELHAACGGPFVSVNCAAIPEGIAERLLFGSVKGAYSGAVDADGYIVAANGGVLFLDEIGELDPAVQGKLLRVLETGEVTPVGAAHGVRVTTRFCFATFRNLRAAMTESEFRPDLYYRIARTAIQIPPLRERREEIAWLVDLELRQGDPGMTAHPRLVEQCLVRPWPGNVRELRSAIRQAAAAARAEQATTVRPEHLDPGAGLAASSTTTDEPVRPQDVTRDQVEAAIAQHAGNLSAAARSLRLHRSQLYRLLERYGLSR